MTPVVSDTSPINFLRLIEAIDVLPLLFSEVLLPPAVVRELQHPRAPSVVREWTLALPAWAREQAPAEVVSGLSLDAGETETISLALELELNGVLIDEADGRQAASNLGLTPIGTLGILITADAHGLLDLETALTRLRSTNFHIGAAKIETLIEHARSRKRGSP